MVAGLALGCGLCAALLVTVGHCSCGQTDDIASDVDFHCEPALLETVSLLQKGVDLTRSRDVSSIASDSHPPTASSPEMLLESAMPVVFLHIPKTGTSFINAIIHLPGVCPDIDPSLSVDEEHFGKHFERNFYLQCPSLCPKMHCGVPSHHHQPTIPTGMSYESIYSGHGFVMLRQPEQRLISEFNMVGHPSAIVYAAFTNLLEPWPGEPDTLLGYAKSRQGTMANMFGDEYLAQDPDVALAVKRIHEFAFVGITEDWNLSICLLHAMFGGTCSSVELENTRVGTNRSVDLYDTSELGNWTDVYDRVIYKEATQIFHDNLQKFAVSDETCQPCWSKANTSDLNVS